MVEQAQAGDLDITVIGGGIAGVSAGYALATHPSKPRVRLVEAEGALAHHTTGRSAAQLIENYGTLPTRGLTKASLPFFEDPPDGLVDGMLLTPRGLLTVAEPDQDEQFELVKAQGQAVNPAIQEISPDEAARLFPLLEAELFSRALLEPDSADIDVAALHQAFVRGLRRAGGSIDLSQRVLALEPPAPGRSSWLVVTTDGRHHADLVVNAAGAWGDEVAELAGVEPVGLQPLRRTAFMAPAPAGHEPAEDEPLLADVDHHWYVKADGVQYLCSPADETPSAPCDAKPEEADVALAIDRVNRATRMAIRTVRSSWAGLRTFTPDQTMVLGPDPEHPTFVWSVGQGGTGIQTAPATGQLVADLAIDGRPGPTLAGHELDLDGLLADRLRANH